MPNFEDKESPFLAKVSAKFQDRHQQTVNKDLIEILELALKVIHRPIIEATFEELEKYKIHSAGFNIRGIELEKGKIAVAICSPSPLSPFEQSDLNNILQDATIYIKIPASIISEEEKGYYQFRIGTFLTSVLKENDKGIVKNSTSHTFEPYIIIKAFLKSILDNSEIKNRRKIIISHGEKKCEAIYQKDSNGVLFYKAGEDDNSPKVRVKLAQHEKTISRFTVIENTEDGSYFLISKKLASQLGIK